MRRQAAGVVILSAVMLGAGIGGEAAAQAPPRPSAAVGPAPAPGASQAARQLQIAFDLAYNLDHDQALAVLDQAMRDHPTDAALPRRRANRETT